MINNRQAFTLLELIVVISLIGTILFFAIPRMDGSLVTNESRNVSKWIILNIAELKDQSVRMQKKMVFHIDMDRNHFQIESGPDDQGSSDRFDDGFDDNATDKQSPEENIFKLPAGYRITAVLFSNDKRVSSGTATIRFYPKAYSDRAVIHLADRQNRKRSYVVEAFLPRVMIYEDHVGF